MKISKVIDLLIIGLISLVLIPVVMLSPSNIPRIIFGIPFLLFCPGYALVAALFPARDSQGGIERVAYSLGLSFAIIVLLGLLLNYVWEISLYPMLIMLEVEVFLALGVAWWRRHNLPESRQPGFSLKRPSFWREKKLLDRFLIIILAAVIIGAGAVSVVTYNKNIQGYTEFYLLGENGKAEGYPRELLVGQEGSVTLVLVNKEQRQMTYQISIRQPDGKVWINKKTGNDITVSLDNGQDWQGDITFVFNKPDEGQKLEFNLFTDDSTEPYLGTYLKIDIEE